MGKRFLLFLLEIMWKSIVVGLAYVIATLVVTGFISMLGVKFPKTNESTEYLIIIIFLTGILIGLTLGLISKLIKTSRKNHIFSIACIIFFNMVSVIIEGEFFAPGLLSKEVVIGLVFEELFVAVIIGIVISKLFLSSKAIKINNLYSRVPWGKLSLRFILSSISYLVFYYIFGTINYSLITKIYYSTHNFGLNIPAPKTVFLVELIRSPLIIISILPLIITLDVSKKLRAILSGTVLFIIGGIIPLLQQLNSLPLFLLMASSVEIFFQNFLTGIVAALLIGKVIK